MNWPLLVAFASFCWIVRIRKIRSIRGCSSAAIREIRGRSFPKHQVARQKSALTALAVMAYSPASSLTHVVA